MFRTNLSFLFHFGHEGSWILIALSVSMTTFFFIQYLVARKVLLGLFNNSNLLHMSHVHFTKSQPDDEYVHVLGWAPFSWVAVALQCGMEAVSL